MAPCSNCGTCCEETEMMLSNEDIDRISKAGYDNFYEMDSDGYLILKNLPGDPPHCTFYDPERKTCKIYTIRPRGCRFYPMIFEVDSHTCIIDDYCPDHATFHIQKSECKELILYYNRIESEMSSRGLKNE